MVAIHSDLQSVEWVRAGHDPGILYDPADDSCIELKGPGMVKGTDPNYGYTANRLDNLKDGTVIAMGTDGSGKQVMRGEHFSAKIGSSLSYNAIILLQQRSFSPLFLLTWRLLGEG